MSHGIIYSENFRSSFGERLITTTLMLLSEHRRLSDVDSRLQTLISISDSLALGTLAFSVDWIAGLLSLHPKDLPQFLSEFLTANADVEALELKSEIAIKSECIELTFYRDVPFSRVKDVVDSISDGCRHTSMWTFAPNSG